MVEGLADVKEKAASLAAATVQMKLEDKRSVSLLSVFVAVVSFCCKCLVFRASSLFCKVVPVFLSRNCPSVCDICLKSDRDTASR